MTAGDSISSTGATVSASVANNQYLTIQPGSGAEWRIESIYCGGAYILYAYDGTNYTEIHRSPAAGKVPRDVIDSDIITNTLYFKVKNVSGASTVFSFNGVVWK